MRRILVCVLAIVILFGWIFSASAASPRAMTDRSGSRSRMPTLQEGHQMKPAKEMVVPRRRGTDTIKTDAGSAPEPTAMHFNFQKSNDEISKTDIESYKKGLINTNLDAPGSRYAWLEELFNPKTISFSSTTQDPFGDEPGEKDIVSGNLGINDTNNSGIVGDLGDSCLLKITYSDDQGEEFTLSLLGEITQAFLDKYDTDGSGVVSFEEMGSFVNDIVVWFLLNF